MAQAYPLDAEPDWYPLSVDMPCVLPEGEEPPELDKLLAHGGHYTPYLEEKEYARTLHQDDPLKALAYEYKYYLLWGEQQRGMRSGETVMAQPTEKLPDLYNETDSMKGMTITECVLNEGPLIGRALQELMEGNEPIPAEDPEKYELLQAVAPEHLQPIEKRVESELLYRELYKLGLESHL